MITIVIPVGPYPVYKKYFQDCLDSLKAQTVPFSEVLLIDDMANLETWKLDYGNLPVRIHKNPWLCGCPHSNNFGVALAKNELIMFLGSDDMARPWLCEDLTKAWEEHKDPLGYYHCDVEYNFPVGETQGCACGAAMVTKTLWKRCGGFPVESSVGASDSILISIFLVHDDAGHMYRVQSDRPPVYYRRHNESLTYKAAPWQGVIFQTRNLATELWTRPQWTKKKRNLIEPYVPTQDNSFVGKVVAVSGGFDPYPHIGHIRHIQNAKTLGDYLIAIVANDEGMMAKKGRCVNSAEVRKEQVESLKWVDKAIISLDKDGACVETLRQIGPDIYAKGGDRTRRNMLQSEIDVCNEIGCEIVYGIGKQVDESREIIKRIKKVKV